MRYEELYRVGNSDKKYKCLCISSGSYLLNLEVLPLTREGRVVWHVESHTAAGWLVHLKGRHKGWDDLDFIEEEEKPNDP